MSKATDLADALVELLNAATLPQTVVAKRRAVPVVQVSDLTTLQVSVFTGVRSADRRTRGEFAHVYKPVIAVQKKLAGTGEAAELAEADDLQSLVEAIEGLLESDDNSELVGLGFIGFDENDPERDAYHADLLRTEGVFANIISLQYQD